VSPSMGRLFPGPGSPGRSPLSAAMGG